MPIQGDIVQAAVDTLRLEYSSISIEDARWLQKIGEERASLLPNASAESIRQMTFFLDTHCVTIHRNGTEWFDVHPILRDVVANIVQRNPSPPASEHE